MNELAAELPAAGVVRVVGPEEAGAGFLVSASGLIVTCAHVLASCAPGATVGIEPHVGRRPLTATVALLRDPPDVAVLRLTAPVPPEVLVLPLGRSPRTPRPGLRTFGYPQMKPEAGLPGELAFYGRTAADGYDQLALRSEEATLGFSGAPIWDPELGVVVGMVKSIARADPGQRLGNTAIGVPVEAIRDRCPELRLPDGCPYRGLEPFTEEHVDYYYGREHATSQLLASLAAGDFVPVVAVSGGGKSSLLQAGLAKGLRDRPVLGLAQRIRCYQRVGSQPHADLLHSLAQHGMLLPQQLAAASPQELAAAIRGAVPPAELIVMVDQFERLYTDCQDAERKRFVALLQCLATDTVKVVIGLRADFYHLALADLGERLAARQVALAPMSEQDLGLAITAPAEKLLRSFQPGLTQRLIADVHGRPGDLPLLQFALTELWEHDAAGAVLTEQTYLGLGVDLPDGTHLPGAQGALIRRAEQLWQDLGPAGQLRLQRILLGLIAAQPAQTSTASPVAGTRDLSRPARLAQWDDDDQRLIQRLIDARLLTADKAPAGGQPTVEVSHEALLRAWPRLQNWLKERSQFVQWRAQDLAPNLERWLDSNKNREFLLPRSLLDPALQWLHDYPDELAGPPADYIQASKRRRTRRRGLLSGAVAVLVVASLAAAGIFCSLRQTAVSQSHLAQSEEMAAESMSLSSANAPLSMLLSLEAYERAPTSEAGTAVIRAEQQPLDYLLTVGTGAVNAIAFEPSGMTFATGDADGRVNLWSTATGRRVASYHVGSAISAIAFSPDGQFMAVGDSSGQVGLWDLKTGSRQLAGAKDPVHSLAFSPNEEFLAVGYDSGIITMLNLATGHSVSLREGYQLGAPVDSIEFTPDSRTLAAGNFDGDIQLWDTVTSRRTATLAAGYAVMSMAFGPDGTTLAVGEYSNLVRLWNIATGRETASFAEGNEVDSVAISPDGKSLAAGVSDGTIGLWNIASRSQTATLGQGSPVEAVAFSPRGQTIAAGDDGGHVGLWNASSSHAITEAGNGSPVTNVAFSHDGRTIAAGDLGGTVDLWDTSSHQEITALSEVMETYSTAFSPDGKTLAIGYLLGANLWNITLRKHPIRYPPSPATLAEGAPGPTASRSALTGRSSPSATTTAASACGTFPAGIALPP